MNFFKAIGDFLKRSEDYFDERVRTGKFPEDIRYYRGVWGRNFVRFIVHSAIAIRRSPFTKEFIDLLIRIHKFLLRFRLYVFTSAVVDDGRQIIFRFYAEIFIIFAITFPSFILLLNFFENSIIFFFFVLLPIIFYNTYCVSSLYNCIYQNRLGVKTTIWKSLQTQLIHFFSVNYATAVQIAIFLIFGVIYFILIVFTGYLFELFKINWADDFYYWFLIIFIGFIFLVSTFTLIVVMNQAYFHTILNKVTLQKAVPRAWIEVKSHSNYLFFFYLLVFLFFTVLVLRSALSYLHLGITISSYFLFYFSFFTGFLLWDQLQRTNTQPAKSIEPAQTGADTKTDNSVLYPVLLFLGAINYALVAFLVLQNYETVYSFVKKQQEQLVVAQGQAIYTNVDYKYTFEYPEDWTIYDWPDGTVTFYHNYTGTVTGGLWLNITVSQHAEDSFRTLYNHPPGIISLDEFTNDTTSKVTNITVQKYEGYVYTEAIEKQPYREYRTHYVIHKGDQDFTLTFTTFANDLGGYDSEIYQHIIESFKFIE